MRPVRAVSDLVYCVKGSSFRFDSVHRYGAFQESNRKSNSNQDQGRQKVRQWYKTGRRAGRFRCWKALRP